MFPTWNIGQFDAPQVNTTYNESFHIVFLQYSLTIVALFTNGITK